jgi:hypothetical protein
MRPLTLARLLSCSILFCAVPGEIEIRGQARNNNDNDVLSAPTPKMIGIPNAKPEHNPPSVSIGYPKDGQRVGEAIIRTVVTASDDTRVESFRFSINGNPINGPQGGSFWAPGMPWPWGAEVALEPGTNTFGVVCGDYWGNAASASVTFVYVPGSDLMLDIANGGQVTPNYQGQSLEFGKTYSMTAHAAKGFRFDGWSGSVTSRRPRLTFVMEPDLLFSASFTDVSRPVNIVMSPRVNRIVTTSTESFIATGKAVDNSSVTNVYYQLNDSGWETATTTNAWLNWETTPLTPVSGRNVLQSYAVDDSGLFSRTNRVRFRY